MSAVTPNFLEVRENFVDRHATQIPRHALYISVLASLESPRDGLPVAAHLGLIDPKRPRDRRQVDPAVITLSA